MPQTDPPPPSLQDRLRLHMARLVLSWRAMRNGSGRALRLRSEDGLIRVSDGGREVYVPHVRHADRFRAGIAARLEDVAAKYLGGTGYVPRPGDVIVDIGAGIGEFTLWCADAGAEVVAFEPDPLAFACLERNTAGLGDVRVFSYAIWKERGTLRFHGSQDTTESSLIEDGRADSRPAEVEAWTLDALPVMVGSPVIDFMKIDGEGVEPEILAGAVRTLRRTRVLAVDVGATGRRANLRQRVEAALDVQNFRPLAHEGENTILALNTAMVGPFNSRGAGRPGS